MLVSSRSALRPASILAAAVGGVLLLASASVALTPLEQSVLALGAAAVLAVLAFLPGRFVSLLMVSLSLAMTLRYLFWRCTETLGFNGPTELALGAGLLLAEFYAALVLALGYLQTVWPLGRAPLPLPEDPEQWPSVDVFVPTLNEDLALVRTTILAAQAMDWPDDKLNVWLLDDGNRAEFAAFAAAAGCRYLARTDNRHAKAGNLNHALARSHGEYVAVLDCDHIPTRAFLQLVCGWLVADPGVALVQTPQHFYTADPFQRNLAAGRRLPAESTMFYGLIQDGNDTFDAAFFCGSGAVLRRAALETVGGFATETVTEDAHTALKLHRGGWSSAYLRLPLAAGLGTERLSRHIRQRMRWTRGMLQIFRLDNPLLGRGLSLGQRLGYLQATLHFLFALPRLAFLTAPLAFLLLGLNLITASPAALISYAVPHLLHGAVTTARLQGRWRHSFWAEIYETAVAPFLVRITLATLLRPHGARFSTTPKTGTPHPGGFDLRWVWPNLVLAALLLAGLARAGVLLSAVEPGSRTAQALWLNALWALVSTVIVLAALAVGRERRQGARRTDAAVILPVTIRLPDGRELAGATRRLGPAGAAVELPPLAEGTAEGILEVSLEVAGEPFTVPAEVLSWAGSTAELRWQPETLAEEAALVQAAFGPADTWGEWSAFGPDRPLRSLGSVLVSIAGLFRRGEGRRRPGRSRSPAAAAAMLGVLLALVPTGIAGAQSVAVRPIPGTTDESDAPAPGTPPAAAVPPATAPAVPPAAGDAAGTRHVVYTLRQLGAPGPLSLRGTTDLARIDFGIRADEVVTAADLSLSGALSPALLPDASNLTVTLNDQYVGTVAAHADQPGFGLDLPVPPAVLHDNNRMEIRFAGRLPGDCTNPLSPLLWATVADTSTLNLTLQRLPAQRDLTRLPLPLFDRHEKTQLTLPFVVPAGAGNDTLRAAGIAASWFGQLAAYRGARFPVLRDTPPQGDAVVLAVGGEGPAPAGVPPFSGPTLAVVANPNDPLSTLLVIGGRTGDEAAAAAQALAVGNRTLSGESATVQAPDLPQRHPYDAPAWLPTDRPVRLGEMVDLPALQVSGYSGSVAVPFRTAPDLYTWRRRPFPLDLRYRAPDAPVVDAAGSRLDVGINGAYLASLDLVPAEKPQSWVDAVLGAPSAATGAQAQVDVPVYDVFGQNQLQFYFDARPMRRAGCTAAPADLRMAVDPDSTLDLSSASRFGVLPNLAWFAGSGFPFTRMADLSETAAVLPDRPSQEEISAFLDIMGRFGNQTGLAALRVAVVRPGEVHDVADRDLLVIGTIAELQQADALLSESPLRLSGNRLQVTLSDGGGVLGGLLGDTGRPERERAATSLSAEATGESAMLVGAESPLQEGRAVVAVLAGSTEALAGAVRDLSDSEQLPLIQGDLALLSGGRVTSYRVGPTFASGSLPFWLWPSWYLEGQPLGLLALAAGGALLLGWALFAAIGRRARGRLARPREG